MTQKSEYISARQHFDNVEFLKGIRSEIKNFLFCNCPCAFGSPLFRNIMIFFLNLFKAIKLALMVIDMNRPAPNLQLGLGNKIWRWKLYWQFAISRNWKKIETEQCKRLVLESFISFVGTVRAWRRKKVLLNTTSYVIIRSQAQL